MQFPLEALRAKNIFDMSQGHVLGHTAQMVFYTEAKGLGDEERKDGMIAVIRELEMLFNLIPEGWERNLCYQFIEKAHADIERGEYWDAIDEVVHAEIPTLPFQRAYTKVSEEMFHGFLKNRMAHY